MLTWCWLMRVRRQRHAHWAIAPDAAAAAGVDVLSVEKTQQWETPASVWEYVTGRWPIDFDACASPLNALAPRYETSDGDFLARTDLRGITIFCNPPYSLDRNATGSCGAIERFICKLVEFANSIFIDITRVYCILKSITCILKRIQYNLYLKEYTICSRNSSTGAPKTIYIRGVNTFIHSSVASGPTTDFPCLSIMRCITPLSASSRAAHFANSILF